MPTLHRTLSEAPEGHATGSVAPPLVDPERSRRHSELLNLQHRQHRELRRRRRRRLSIAILIIVPSLALASWLWWQARRAEAARVAYIEEKEALVAALARSFDPAQVAERRAEMITFSERLAADQEVARIWLEYLAIEQLSGAGEPGALDRALEQSDPAGSDPRLAYARVLKHHGVASAGVAPAQNGDALFELAAGVRAERDGEPGAPERFRRALELRPGFVIAHVLLARNALLAGDLPRAGAEISALESRTDNLALGRALRAGVWLLEPVPPGQPAPMEPPPQARVAPAERRRVPAPLLLVLDAVDATVAARAGDRPSAQRRFEKAERRAQGRLELRWIIARELEAGLTEVAVAAARRLAELGDPARALEFEVAARLSADELAPAQVAAARLPDGSPLKGALSAVVAYEALEPESLLSALGGRDAQLAASPSLAALRLMPEVLVGREVLEPERIEPLVSSGVIWGELVAVDAALDAGRLTLAESIVDRWGTAPSGPSRLVRRARLARYVGRLEEARELSRAAFGATPGRRAVLEYVQALLALKDGRGALAFWDDHAESFGLSRDYVRAVVLAAAGSWGLATQVVSKRALPPETHPMPDRLFAARALAILLDSRAPQVLRPLRAKFPENPDLIDAAEALR